MNARARNRLIGVTVLILIIAAAVFYGSGAFGDAAYNLSSVSQIKSDSSFVGKRVIVAGVVVAGSWDKRNDPMVFSISDVPVTSATDASATPAEVKVVYTGVAPNTFGSGSNVNVTGMLQKDGSITSTDMTVKCPSTYQSRSGAASVDDLLGAKSGAEMPVQGYLKAGSLQSASASERFVLTANASGGAEVPVVFGDTMPAGSVDGARVIVTGTLENGKLVARKVALSK